MPLITSIAYGSQPSPFPPGYAGVILADAPIAYWRMDGGITGVGGTHVDYTGNGHDLDSPAYSSTYPRFQDPSLIANDSNTSIFYNRDLPGRSKTYTLPQITQKISIECWYKPTNISAGLYYQLMSKANPNTTTNTYGFFHAFPATLNGVFLGPLFRIQVNETGTERYIQGNSTPIVGQPNHLVGTYDGIDLKIYLNGVLSNTNNVPGLTLRTHSASDEFCVGAGHNSGDVPYDAYQGGIDEAAVYDYDLTLEQVVNHYNAGI